jgi:type I restriction enzyme M protein
MNQPVGFQDKVSFIWSVADLLRGDFKAHEYGQVVLPLVVLRRLECALTPTKQAVVAKAEQLGDSPGRDAVLKAVAKHRFWNASPLDLTKILADPGTAAANLRTYLAGFSPSAREVLDAYGFPDKIARLDKAGLLYQVLARFADLDLSESAVPNETMGYVFEELLRRFSEMSNETAGEHFTPREVIRLMVSILLAEDREALAGEKPVRTIYDPACGTGGMLTGAQDYLRRHNPAAELQAYGQEINPETWAVCRSDLMIQGQDPARIVLGNSLADEDGHAGQRFDYLLANPPFGVDWKKYADAITAERDSLGHKGRYGAGLPRVSDGSLLFLQHMLSKMKPATADSGGTRLAIVFSGSPLFAGAAGGGESEIRRWILENDWLEGIVALPDQLFYNTGISTYFWVLSNRKSPERRGKVALVDARESFARMRKSLGDKRKYVPDDAIAEITRLYDEALQADDKRAKVFEREAFGFQRITVERPLRRVWQLSDGAVDELAHSRAWTAWAVPPKGAEDPVTYVHEVERHQLALTHVLRELARSAAQASEKDFARLLDERIQEAGAPPLIDWLMPDLGTPYDEDGWTVYDLDCDGTAYGITDDGNGWYAYRKDDESEVDMDYQISPEMAAIALFNRLATEAHRIEVPHSVRKAVVAAAAVPSEDAPVLTDRKGQPLPDPDLRDQENVPLPERWFSLGEPERTKALCDSAESHLQTEIKPYAADAWVDHDKTKVGVEIPFIRHFYEYLPPRPLAEIDAELLAAEERLRELLAGRPR